MPASPGTQQVVLQQRGANSSKDPAGETTQTPTGKDIIVAALQRAGTASECRFKVLHWGS